jgi:hypothetical protein
MPPAGAIAPLPPLPAYLLPPWRVAATTAAAAPFFASRPLRSWASASTQTPPARSVQDAATQQQCAVEKECVVCLESGPPAALLAVLPCGHRCVCGAGLRRGAGGRAAAAAQVPQVPPGDGGRAARVR